MDRETQLDTHDIDKLLDEDDFIDDFDFSEDSSDQFVDVDSDLDGESNADLAGESGFDEFTIDESLVEGSSAEAGVAAVALELDDLECATSESGKRALQGFKIVIILAVIFWLVQLFGVLYLLKQPVIIPGTLRPMLMQPILQWERSQLQLIIPSLKSLFSPSICRSIHLTDFRFLVLKSRLCSFKRVDV